MGRMDIRKKMEARRLAAATIMSHKQKKKLEKIVLRKKLKSTRTSLIKDLKKYQLKPEQQKLLHSTSSMQTKGLKRFAQDNSSEPNSALELSRKLEELGEARLDAATLYKRKQRRVQSKKVHSDTDSQSEDTDQVSSDEEEDTIEDAVDTSDTEIYESNDSRSLVQLDQPQSKPQIPLNVNHEASSIKKPPTLHKNCKSSKMRKLESSKVAPPNEAKSAPPKKAVYVETFRLPEIEKLRSELPIIGEEQRIMEEITYNDVVVISGETGSGKTTQVPQFLYEAGYALNGKMIGLTEPRRVAAVSMSNRVANELNLHNGEVSYQIRFSGDVSKNTKIKFMTDGILLKECQKDFLLSNYSAIIIDEAHERSVFSDILIGLLSRIVPLRAKKGDPLKLVIMSATLRVADFTENSSLFKIAPPMINIDARQYPVAVQFRRTTPTDWLQAAYKKVCVIHRRLPKGGILVFVTSQQDVRILCRKLRHRFPMNKICSSDAPKNKRRTTIKISQKDPVELRQVQEAKESITNLSDDVVEERYKLELITERNEEDEEHESEKEEESDKWNDNLSEEEDDDGEEFPFSGEQPLYCLGLYAMLPIDKQKLVFKDPPSDARFCVISTNVAETSLTIPNIRYVIDTGKEKTKVYDTTTGISKFLTTWTSKASAEQRKGRAGRTGPGHCFRLYSSAVFMNDFPDFAEPQVIKKPIEDLMLQMKSMNIDNVVNFPFPTRPSEEALVAAEKKLIILGALNENSKKLNHSETKKSEFCSRPTKLGKVMACFSVGARFAKMLALSPRDLLPHVIAIVSALTVREMFLTDLESYLDKKNKMRKRSKWHEKWKGWRGRGDNMRALGDVMLILRAVSESQKAGCSREFCENHGLRVKSMLEVHKLRTQLTNEVNSAMRDCDLSVDQSLSMLDDRAKILRQLVLSSFFDHVARRTPDCQAVSSKDIAADEKNKPQSTKLLRNAYECLEVERPVYISQESVMKSSQPEFIIYKEIYEGVNGKMYMRDIMAIEPEWLPEYGFKLCKFSDPPDETSLKTKYDPKRDLITCRKTSIYGPMSWSIGPVEVPLHLASSGTDIYKHFAMYLLNGQALAWFQKYSSKLLSPPSIMIKPWAKLQPRTEKILHALIARDVKSRKQFLRILKTEPEYLKQEYLSWLPESIHWSVTQDWAQLVAQAC